MSCYPGQSVNPEEIRQLRADNARLEAERDEAIKNAMYWIEQHAIEASNRGEAEHQLDLARGQAAEQIEIIERELDEQIARLEGDLKIAQEYIPLLDQLMAERDKLTEVVKECEVALVTVRNKVLFKEVAYAVEHALALIHTLQSGEKKEGANE